MKVILDITGRQGVYNEASGLKIAYLSGIQHNGPSSSKKDFQFNFEDVKSLQIRLENESGFKGVDILLTTQWPAGIQNCTALKPVRTFNFKDRRFF